ncbi:MAG: isocitrate lyase/PEP mutase family protein [Ruminiclostridium sp.]|nr:isocitrate lyase/PEP mutase family protein [Ruminiclostridium sp.]
MTIKMKIKINEIMEKGKTITAIGAYDAFSALMVEQAGFDAVYVGSYSTEASFLGRPDLALMSRNDRLSVARNIVKVVDIPVIVDAEEGFGNAINLMDAVKDFESSGAAGIHIDDEVMPSKCPFVPGIPLNNLISVDEMCGKIQAAVKARNDPDFLIIARCDAIGTMQRTEYYKDGINEVVGRSNEYARAGADAIFVMALNENDLGYFKREIKAPLVGVFAPAEPLPLAAFRKEGYFMTIGSILCLYAAAKGIKDALKAFKETEDWNAITNTMIDDRQFFEILKISEYQALYGKYKIV